MKRIGILISRYLLSAILPYFIASWALLSVILFVLQASRYADIFFSIHIPANLVWQLSVALIPSVIAFTCPMAILVGTIIGLTRMQGDSELVAIRASGVGNLQIALPIMLLGILLSAFAFFVNLKGVPFAAGIVRNIALQTAIKKLESPIEPGIFNTEVAGYTIFVRGGDVATGRWKNIFIYSEDKANNSLRLITSSDGRVDTTEQVSELVLESASVTTLPLKPGAGNYVSENLGEIRLAIRTTRGELIEKLSRSELTPEELGLQGLSEYGANKDGNGLIEAQILQNRGIVLSISPFIFCILGTLIVLRLNRGGRNFGIALAIAVLIGYYLLSFLGEQLARTGSVSVNAAGLIPIVGSLVTIAWFAMSRRLRSWAGVGDRLASLFTGLWESRPKLPSSNLFVDLTTGLRDFDILRDIFKNYLLTLLFLISIFVIFTAFELWKFAGTIDGGVWLLLKYLVYLTPFMYLQIAASAAMIATLATFAIKSRQNEIVTWISAGQSVYRLLLPCFLVMLLLGGLNWVIQERVLPQANQMQDAARTLLRNKGVAPSGAGKYWVATDHNIYSFYLAEENSASDNANANASIGEPSSEKNPSPQTPASASDNETRVTCPGCVRDITIYALGDKGQRLQTVYRSNAGSWASGNVNLTGPIERSDLQDGKVTNSIVEKASIDERDNPFTEIRRKPTHLDSKTLANQVATADAEVEQRSLTVALEKKQVTLFLPLVMALFTAPFALSLSRKGKAATVVYAIALWLLFTGTSSVFEQLGLNASISPMLAVWSTPVIFALVGLFLLSRVKT